MGPEAQIGFVVGCDKTLVHVHVGYLHLYPPSVSQANGRVV